MNTNLSFYENYYTNIFNYILHNNVKNDNCLTIITDNEFNPVNDFAHYIKDKNITINLIINDTILFDKMIDDINGEDCEINIYKKIQPCARDEVARHQGVDNILNNSNSKSDIIILFHLYSLEYLKDMLRSFEKISKEDSLIYIYCSLSNEKKILIDYRNNIRDKISKYTNNKIGCLLSYNDVLQIIENNDNYYTKSIRIYKKNTYLIYGNNTVYEIILEKK